MYFARPRRKDLRNERILALMLPPPEQTKPRVLEFDAIDRLFRSEQYRYVTWGEIQEADDLVPVYSFLVVHCEGRILTHETGKFSEDNHPSRGRKSIGFGSAVRVQDSDLLYDAYHGVIGSASNELIYSLGLPRELVRRARYGSEIHPHCGIETPESGFGRHLLIALSYRMPRGFALASASLSRNRLQWTEATDRSLVHESDQATEILFQSARVSEFLD